MPKTVLIVDDKQSVYDSLALNFGDFGYGTLWAADSSGARKLLAAESVSAVLLDLSLGAESGLDLLEEIRRTRPELPVVMITGYGTLELAVKSIKIGAFDFLPKPLDFDRLRRTVEQALATVSGAGDEEPESRVMPSGMYVSRLEPLQKLFRRARLLAATDLSVLVTGESGCGKEHLVDFIHSRSARSHRPMERINCSAFAESLIDNELFGHEKGAFTGAGDAYAGLFERADGGTLHLDEIGDLALPNQARLLRVLEDGRVRRVGGSSSVTVDVRVIASTNKNLPEMIRSGRFREDLFYRLNAAYLYLPPLRERRGDIEPLIAHFLDACRNGDGPRKRLSPAAMDALLAHDWPGNVRELRNAVRTGVAVSETPVIEVGDLPEYLEAPVAAGAERQLEDVEREHILRVLEDNRFNKKKTAERLGIDRKTLYNKMKHYGIV